MAPFPYLPMAAVVACLLSLLIVQMGTFAYAGYMVEYLGVVEDKDEAGYYAGLLSSGFMIGTLLSSHVWGLIADRHGSRFVLICGVSSVAVLSIAFGFSKSFTWAVSCRFLLGLFDGMTAAAKTIVTEVCGMEHKVVCMGLLTSSWSLGAVLGPGVGGMLAEPARHYPRTFSEDGIFGRNPYLLSNVVGAGLSLMALLLVLCFLKGKTSGAGSDPTRPLKAWCSSWYSFFQRKHDDDGCNHANTAKNDSRDPDHTPDTSAAESLTALEEYGTRKPSWMQVETLPPLTTRRTRAGSSSQDAREGLGQQRTGDVKKESLLAQGHIRVLLLIDAICAVSWSGFDEVYPLWALSSVAKGGLDWSSFQIGQMFFACGLMVLVFELFAVPWLTPWLGVKTSQRLGSVFEIPVYLLFPLLSGVNNSGFPVKVPMLILLFTCYVCANSFYVGLALTANTATGLDRRGEMNGLSMTCASLGRTISPVVFGWLFTFSINGDHSYPFNYHLGFYFLAFTRLVAAWLGWSRINDAVNME